MFGLLVMWHGASSSGIGAELGRIERCESGRRELAKELRFLHRVIA